MDKKQLIAKRAAAYFAPGDVVNVGIGIPSYCADYAAPGVLFHTENGVIGVGESARGLMNVESYCNAGGVRFVPVAGASSFSIADSFAIIRCGRLDATVLGGLQVSSKGDLANWAMPERAFGMGGAMDLCNGAKKVIVAMELTAKDGSPKIVNQCSLPLTGLKCVHHIVTECCVIDVTAGGLLLREIAPGYTPADIQALVEPSLIVAEDLQEMAI